MACRRSARSVTRRTAISVVDHLDELRTRAARLGGPRVAVTFASLRVAEPSPAARTQPASLAHQTQKGRCAPGETGRWVATYTRCSESGASGRIPAASFVVATLQRPGSGASAANARFATRASGRSFSKFSRGLSVAPQGREGRSPLGIGEPFYDHDGDRADLSRSCWRCQSCCTELYGFLLPAFSPSQQAGPPSR